MAYGGNSNFRGDPAPTPGSDPGRRGDDGYIDLQRIAAGIGQLGRVARDATDPANRAAAGIKAMNDALQSAARGGPAAGEAARGFAKTLEQVAGLGGKLAGVSTAAAGVFNALSALSGLGGGPAAAIASVGSTLNGLLTRLPQLGTQLGGLIGGELGGGIAAVSIALGPYGVAVGAAVSALSQIPTMLKSLADSANSYVRAFSPVLSMRYDRAWADLNAAIGENLTPVVEAATSVIRWLGDSVAGLTPYLKPLVDVYMRELGGAFSAVGAVVREVMTHLVVMAEAAQPLAPLLAEIAFGPMRALTFSLRALASAMHAANEAVGRFFGIQLPEFDGKGVNKAARGGGVGGSPDDAWKELVKAGLMAGAPAEKRPEVQTAEYLKDIKKTVEDIKRLMETAENVTGAVGDVVQGQIDDAIEPLKRLNRLFEDMNRTFTMRRN